MTDIIELIDESELTEEERDYDQEEERKRFLAWDRRNRRVEYEILMFNQLTSPSDRNYRGKSSR